MIAWIEEGSIQVPNMLFRTYRQIGLDEKELILLLQILSFYKEGNEFPTPEQLSERMTITSSECSTILGKLVQHQLISIEEGVSKDGIRFEKYSLAPLWARLIDEMTKQSKQEKINETFVAEKDLYTLFEHEFGRPLSPMECENLAMWIDVDHHEPMIIRAALREAVISNKLNFRYIDRILFEWKKNGVRTIEDARAHGMKVRRNQRPVQTTKKEPRSNTVPFYNWLEQ